MPEIVFDYFSAVEGRVVARYGTDVSIGATRGPGGWIINPDLIVAIPRSETNRYRKEYNDAVRLGDLKERTKDEFAAQEAKREQAEEEERKRMEADAKRVAEAAATEPAPADAPQPEEAQKKGRRS